MISSTMEPTGLSPSSHLKRRSSRNQLSCLWHSFLEAICISLTICTCTEYLALAPAWIRLGSDFHIDHAISMGIRIDWQSLPDMQCKAMHAQWQGHMRILLPRDPSLQAPCSARRVLVAYVSGLHDLLSPISRKHRSQDSGCRPRATEEPDQIGGSDVRWVLLAPLHEFHGLAIADGTCSALLIWLQALIKQPLGLLHCTASNQHRSDRRHVSCTNQRCCHHTHDQLWHRTAVLEGSELCLVLRKHDKSQAVRCKDCRSPASQAAIS